MNMLARPVGSRHRPVIEVHGHTTRWGTRHYTARLRDDRDVEAIANRDQEAPRRLLERLRDDGRSGWLPDYKVVGVINR